jgi:hypothetical protein
MQFKVEDLIEGTDDLELVHEETIGTTRWLVHKQLVYNYKGSFWLWRRADGATEYQDSDWSYEDVVELQQVEPYQETITKYRPI